MIILYVFGFVSLYILYPSMYLKHDSVLEDVQHMVSFSKLFAHCLAEKATWNNYQSLSNNLFTFFLFSSDISNL